MPGKRTWLLLSLVAGLSVGAVLWGLNYLPARNTSGSDRLSTSHYAPPEQVFTHPPDPSPPFAADPVPAPPTPPVPPPTKTDFSEVKDRPAEPPMPPPGVAEPPTNLPSPLAKFPEPAPLTNEPPPVAKKPETASPSGDAPAPSQPAAGQLTTVACPWIIRLEITEGRSRLEARTDNGIQIKISCDRINLAAPEGNIEAVGGVFFSAGTLEGSCDQLRLSWRDSRICLLGKIRLKGRHEEQEVDLAGDNLTFKLAPTARARGDQNRPIQPVAYPPPAGGKEPPKWEPAVQEYYPPATGNPPPQPPGYPPPPPPVAPGNAPPPQFIPGNAPAVPPAAPPADPPPAPPPAFDQKAPEGNGLLPGAVKKSIPPASQPVVGEHRSLGSFRPAVSESRTGGTVPAAPPMPRPNLASR